MFFQRIPQILHKYFKTKIEPAKIEINGIVLITINLKSINLAKLFVIILSLLKLNLSLTKLNKYLSFLRLLIISLEGL